jgi:hypothetical protein
VNILSTCDLIWNVTSDYTTAMSLNTRLTQWHTVYINKYTLNPLPLCKGTPCTPQSTQCSTYALTAHNIATQTAELWGWNSDLTFQRGVTGSARIAKTRCTAHHMQALILSLISRQQMESNCNWTALCMSAKVLSLLWCERRFLQIIYKLNAPALKG